VLFAKSVVEPRSGGIFVAPRPRDESASPRHTIKYASGAEGAVEGRLGWSAPILTEDAVEPRASRLSAPKYQ
jgi:hypothetical protein